MAGDHRPWVTSFEGAGLTLWLTALLSAVPITFFFYMDQNISSLLCQLPEYNLQVQSPGPGMSTPYIQARQPRT